MVDLELRRVVLDRLILYYRYLADLEAAKPVETITSARLGEALEVDPSQVRKDFAAIGLMGMSRIGYDACEVCSTIRRVVGFDLSYPAALVGAGMLGSAILGYTEFERYGFRVVAAFDRDPFKVGRRIGGRTIMPSTELGGFVEKHHIPLAILTTPAEAAQELTDTLVAAGVAAIWNFTSVRLTVPPGVLVRNERFTAGLAEIAYHLSRPELSEAAHAPTSRMT